MSKSQFFEVTLDPAPQLYSPAEGLRETGGFLVLAMVETTVKKGTEVVDATALMVKNVITTKIYSIYLVDKEKPKDRFVHLPIKARVNNGQPVYLFIRGRKAYYRDTPRKLQPA